MKVPLTLVVILTVCYLVFFCWFTLGRHAKTNSTRFDLGINEQVVWNTMHGRFLEMTDPYGTKQVSRLVFHSDVLLAVIALPYAVWPSSETLLILQTLALASGAVATYLIAHRLLNKEWWGVVFAFLYVINPGLQWTNIFDFHAVAFATPLILWTFWFALQKKWIPMFIFAFFAVISKEEIGLLLSVIGIYILLQHQAKKIAWAMIGAPVLWSVLMFLVVMPIARQSLPTGTVVYESNYGNTASDIVTSTIQHPFSVARTLLSNYGLTYVGQLAFSFGGLPLLSWVTLGALPEYVINILSNKPAQHLLISHYTSGLTPFMVLGSVVAVSWIIRRKSHPIVSGVLVGWLLVWGITMAWYQGPLPGAKHDHSRVVTWKNVYAVPVKEWSTKIPSEAKVSVTNNVGAHFTRRQYLYSFPLGLELANYAVVLEGHQTPIVTNQDTVTKERVALQQNNQWKTVYQQGDLTVLQRTN